MKLFWKANFLELFFDKIWLHYHTNSLPKIWLRFHGVVGWPWVFWKRITKPRYSDFSASSQQTGEQSQSLQIPAGSWSGEIESPQQVWLLDQNYSITFFYFWRILQKRIASAVPKVSWKRLTGSPDVTLPLFLCCWGRPVCCKVRKLEEGRCVSSKSHLKVRSATKK